MPQGKKSSGDGLRDTLVLTRERLQTVMDDAVARGHMTREAANNLVAELVRRGRRELEDVLSDTDQLMGRPLERVRQMTGSSFPVEGYDDLTAAQVAGQLSELTPAELRKVRDYERRHGNRKGVLSAVEKRLKA